MIFSQNVAVYADDMKNSAREKSKLCVDKKIKELIIIQVKRPISKI